MNPTSITKIAAGPANETPAKSIIPKVEGKERLFFKILSNKDQFSCNRRTLRI